MATTNRLLYDFEWNLESDAFADFKRFREVIKGYKIQPEPSEEEVVEAFETITGKTIKQSKVKE